MKDDILTDIIFNLRMPLKTKPKNKKIIYEKNPDEKKKNKLIVNLEKKAYKDSLKFNRRKLSSLFTPVFGGRMLFSEETDFIAEKEEELINFGDLFFGRIEKDFGIDIINYSLIDLKKKAEAESCISFFFDFEIFNYNFDTHKPVKSEFVKISNIKRLNEIATSILRAKKTGAFEKKTAKNVAVNPVITAKPDAKKTKTADISKTEDAAGRNADNAGKPVSEKERAVKKAKGTALPKVKMKPQAAAKVMAKPKPALTKGAVDASVPKADKADREAGQQEAVVAPEAGESPEICTAESIEAFKSIGEQIGIISSNWSFLSPAENIPLLEAGEPAEISEKSLVRIYFQKPNVRQVVWRFREKPETESSKPILRVYKDGEMLWYDVLDRQFGSRYIIFSEDLELSQTWVEIGYLTGEGKFIFIARSPEWPPVCLLKKFPKLKLKKTIRKNTLLIGATEGIPGGKSLPVGIKASSSGFSGSGAGINQ